MATGIFARRTSNYKNSPDYSYSETTENEMKNQLEKLRKDAIKAGKIIGVNDIEFTNFPDNELDKISNLKLTKTIESVIRIFKPNVVYTHSQYDVNIDHQKTFQATITATRPNIENHIDDVYTYEVPSSTEWSFSSGFSPNVFVDITKELAFKLKALKAYKNEIHDFPHPRSIESLESIAKRWGSVCGFNRAEAFSLLRSIRKKI